MNKFKINAVVLSVIFIFCSFCGCKDKKDIDAQSKGPQLTQNQIYQKNADDGKESWRLDIEKVAKDYIQNELKISKFEIIEIGDNEKGAFVVAKDDSKNNITIRLFQPDVKGDKGIWIVDETPVKTNVKLYFTEESFNYFETENREIQIPLTQSVTDAVVAEIIKGPKENGHMKVIKGDVKVLSTNVKDKICTVDLSKEFMENKGGSTSEYFAIYSIVNSLCTIPTIEKVQFLIDGEKCEDFSGHFLFTDLFEPDLNQVH